jgi:hypothetical protein
MFSEVDTERMKVPEKQSACVSSRRRKISPSLSLPVLWEAMTPAANSPVRPWSRWPNSCAITTSAAHFPLRALSWLGSSLL